MSDEARIAEIRKGLVVINTRDKEDLAWLCARVEALRGALQAACIKLQEHHDANKHTGNSGVERELMRARAALGGQP